MQGFSRETINSGASAWDVSSFLFSGVTGDTANLWRLPFDSRLNQVTGSAERLTFGTGLEAHPAASRDGRIVFATLESDIDIWSIPLDANTAKLRGAAERLVKGAARDDQPSLAAAGSHLAYRSNRKGPECIRVRDLASGREREICSNNLSSVPPSLSAKGNWVLYRVGDETRTESTAGDTKLVCRGCRHSSWFADEKRFLFLRGTRRVIVGSIDHRKTTDVLRSEEYDLAEPSPSPDGRWIAFHTLHRPESRQVFVAPFREVEAVRERDWIAITGDVTRDRSPRWSPDGKLLYFLSERDGFRCIWAQRLDPHTKRPRGAASAVHHFHHARLSLNQATPSDIGLSVSTGRLAIAVSELTGNLWQLNPR
jgi:Tol biopolymer transport system component